MISYKRDGYPDVAAAKAACPKVGEELAFPTPASQLFETPFAYVPSGKLLGAVEAALRLGYPLLVTGDPGTGKSQLASFVARWLGLLRPIQFEVKSTTESGNLFYTVDHIRYFRDANDPEKRGTIHPLDYIEFQALGLAILRAADPDVFKKKMNSADAERLQKKMDHMDPDLWPDEPAARLKFPHRSVVLIDEVDKAPRDVPNDILNEIESFYFRIPELKKMLGGDDRIEAGKDLRPVVIFTSNSETNMPPPFLRRCVYFNIEFPEDPKKLEKIIEGRLFAAKISVSEVLIKDVVTLVLDSLRTGRYQLTYLPGTAEILAFLRNLCEHGISVDTTLENCCQKAYLAAGVLAKDADDLKKVQDLLVEKFGETCRMEA